MTRASRSSSESPVPTRQNERNLEKSTQGQKTSKKDHRVYGCLIASVMKFELNRCGKKETSWNEKTKCLPYKNSLDMYDNKKHHINK